MFSRANSEQAGWQPEGQIPPEPVIHHLSWRFLKSLPKPSTSPLFLSLLAAHAACGVHVEGGGGDATVF